MSRFLADRFQSLDAYTPGEQPTDMKYIKLNTNESPFPPSPAVLRAISEERVRELRLYSDPTCTPLRLRIAAQFGFEKENVFVSNGSDDILNFSFMAFCDGNRCGVAFPEISYGFYKVYAALYGVDAKAIPLAEDFSVRAEDYLDVGRTVVIANPNAPTGILLPLSEIERLLKANSNRVVVVDEAYIDFGGESAVKLIEKYDNLLVTQTFSKSRSLAGARLGFGVANEKIIADLMRIKYSTNPYNVNRASAGLGMGAILDKDYFVGNCKKVIEDRKFTKEKLIELGFTLTDSYANFLFAKSDKISGKELYLKLKENGVLVRHFDSPRISDYVRITIGNREQMQKFIETTAKILEEK
jgi:histidinol-phosphate aminotransferase